MIIGACILVALFAIVWAVRRAQSRANLTRYYEDLATNAHERDNPTVAFHVRKGDGTTRNISVHRS